MQEPLRRARQWLGGAPFAAPSNRSDSGDKRVPSNVAKWDPRTLEKCHASPLAWISTAQYAANGRRRLAESPRSLASPHRYSVWCSDKPFRRPLMSYRPPAREIYVAEPAAGNVLWHRVFLLTLVLAVLMSLDTPRHMRLAKPPISAPFPLLPEEKS